MRRRRGALSKVKLKIPVAVSLPNNGRRGGLGGGSPELVFTPSPHFSRSVEPNGSARGSVARLEGRGVRAWGRGVAGSRGEAALGREGSAELRIAPRTAPRPLCSAFRQSFQSERG